MKKTSLKPTASLTPAAVNQRAYQLLYLLTPEEFKELTAFSAWQLRVGCRHGGAARELQLKEAADLLHDAFETVLAGLGDPAKGRHPQADDVKNLDAFLQYLRGVIRSVRHKQATSAAQRAQVIGMTPTEAEESETRARLNPDEEAEWRDFNREFFAAIRRELDDPDKYAVALDLWQADFFRVERLSQLGLQPKAAAKLRAKAQRLYRRLSEPVSLSAESEVS